MTAEPRTDWPESPAVPAVRRATETTRFPLIGLLLAFAIAFALPVIAAATITSADVAQPALARLVDGLTGSEALLRAEEPRIREAATKAGPGDLIEVAGFPVRGAGIPRDEVVAGTPEQWRRTLLDRSAVLLYDQGTHAFAESEEASGFEPGGGAWAISLLDGRVHRWLVILQWIPVLAVIVLSIGLVTMQPLVRRWRLLGLTMAVGAVLPFFLALVTMLIATVAGGAPGTLSDEAADVVATLARGPAIQAGAVALGGLALWWWAGRPVTEEDPAARLAAARADREARRRAAAGLPPEPKRPR